MKILISIIATVIILGTLVQLQQNKESNTNYDLALILNDCRLIEQNGIEWYYSAIEARLKDFPNKEEKIKLVKQTISEYCK